MYNRTHALDRVFFRHERVIAYQPVPWNLGFPGRNAADLKVEERFPGFHYLAIDRLYSRGDARNDLPKGSTDVRRYGLSINGSQPLIYTYKTQVGIHQTQPDWGIGVNMI